MFDKRFSQLISGLTSLTVVSSPALAAERCNPPHRNCVESGISFPCPPCPPGGISLASPGALEGYRESLEGYRKSLEKDRIDDSNRDLGKYERGIKEYQDGISEYRDAVSKADRPEGDR